MEDAVQACPLPLYSPALDFRFVMRLCVGEDEGRCAKAY